MTARQVIRRILNRRSQLIMLSAAAAVCLVATVILTAQVFWKLGEYRTAFSDNIQWTVAKLEVEHAKYVNAIERLDENAPGTLPAMRQRFDVFYSRVDTLGNASTYREALSSDRAREVVEQISSGVQAQVTIIDASDATVFARKAELLDMAESLTQPVLRLSSIGISYDVTRREMQRTALADKLLQLIVLSLALLAVLCSLLALFWQLYIRYRRRAMQNRATLNRLATIINTTQDVMLVICPSGRIIEGNRVGDNVFGLRVDGGQERFVSDFIFRMDEAGQRVPVTGEMLISSCATGPNLCTKLHARDKTGRYFPIELSANMASRSGDNVCVCFVRDISQRVATEAEMHAARDKALAGERAKARFLGMISHEMRTPLNGILGALDLLDDTALTPEQAQYTQIMQSSGQLVLNQINDALDVTQADGGRLHLASDRFDLDALLHRLIQGQQAHAAAQGSEIRLIPPAAPLGVALGDESRLHQILLNLLSNAIKFTRDGQITIEATRLGPPDAGADALSDEVEFQIVDTGIGIDDDDLDRIFNDYVRLEDSDVAEGTGLGLGIARHLVRLMGGTIGAESERNEGSLFWVRLPLPRATENTATDLAQPAFMAPYAPIVPCSVLIVEDNDTSRFVLNEMLLKDGHDVVATTNGTDAVDVALLRRFDLILMDINMPGIDGIEATRQIRSGGGASANSRIIALTAHYRPEDNDRFGAIEIDGICTKPLRRKALREILAGGPVRNRLNGTARGVDKKVLDQLCAVLPATNLSRVLDEFVAEGQAFVDGLAAARLGAPDGFANALHQFAGSAATFGAIALQSALCRAEMAVLSGDQSGADRALADLPDLWQQALSEIHQHRHAA